MSGVVNKMEAKLKVENDYHFFEENNFENLLSVYIAGPIAHGMALGVTHWIDDERLLDRYLTKLLNIYVSKIEFEHFLYRSFSDLVLRILLSGYFDFLYYFALAARLNPKIKKAFTNKKIHRDLSKSLKYDIIKVKKELRETGNWELVCEIADELYKSKTLSSDQLNSIFSKHNLKNELEKSTVPFPQNLSS